MNSYPNLHFAVHNFTKCKSPIKALKTARKISDILEEANRKGNFRAISDQFDRFRRWLAYWRDNGGHVFENAFPFFGD